MVYHMWHGLYVFPVLKKIPERGFSEEIQVSSFAVWEDSGILEVL